jgi:hypothetical protein
METQVVLHSAERKEFTFITLQGEGKGLFILTGWSLIVNVWKKCLLKDTFRTEQ